MVWGGRPPSSRGPGPTPIGSTCLTLKFMKQHDYILPFNTKHLTIAFLDISLSLLWFQKKKTKISVFSKQKLWPSSLKIITNHMSTIITLIKTCWTCLERIIHWHLNEIINKKMNVVSLNNLLKKFTYHLIHSLRTNHMSGFIKG